jgi:hypothetical protein
MYLNYLKKEQEELNELLNNYRILLNDEYPKRKQLVEEIKRKKKLVFCLTKLAEIETKEKIKEYEEFLSFKYISEDFKNLCLLKIKNLWNDINKK